MPTKVRSSTANKGCCERPLPASGKRDRAALRRPSRTIIDRSCFTVTAWRRRFSHKGATIYTSLEPCPMCATTILVCRVKRTVFLLQDHTYGGAWTIIKKTFYDKYNLTYGQLDLSYAKSPLIQRAHDDQRRSAKRSKNFIGQNVRYALLRPPGWGLESWIPVLLRRYRP